MNFDDELMMNEIRLMLADGVISQETAVKRLHQIFRVISHHDLWEVVKRWCRRYRHH